MKLYGSLSRLVAILFRKDSQDITLRPNQSTTYTAARDVQLPPGDTAHELMSATSTSTMTNKTFDADGTGNSLSNIDDGNIKAAAAIDATKLADGSVTNTEFQYINSLTSNAQDQLDAKASITYVDAAINGLSWKAPVRAATTTLGVLATDFEDGDTVDGVTLATGDRLLIKDQLLPQENGIYVVAASGSPTRAADMDTGAEFDGSAVFVLEGTANASKGFVETDTVAVVDTDPVTFQQFSDAGAVTYTANRALQTSAGGAIEVSATTSTELGYVSGVTSAIQTQLNGKASTALNNLTVASLAAGSLLVGSSSSAVANLAIGAAGTKLTSNGSTATWADSTFEATWATADGTTKAITHSLGTKDVQVEVYDMTDDSTLMVDAVVRTSTSVVTLTSSEAPGAASWRVLISAQ